MKIRNKYYKVKRKLKNILGRKVEKPGFEAYDFEDRFLQDWLEDALRRSKRADSGEAWALPSPSSVNGSSLQYSPSSSKHQESQ